MSPSAHSTRCALAAVTTPDECKCRCEGAFHGGPHTERARSLVWDPPSRSQNAKRNAQRARRAVRKINQGATDTYYRRCSDLVGFLLTAHVIDDETEDRHKELVHTIDRVTAPFVAVISHSSSTLLPQEVAALEHTLKASHLLCSVCVEILKAHDAVTGLTKETAEAIARTIVEAASQKVPTPVQELLIKALANAILKAVPIALDDEMVANLRCAGIIFCPNIQDHVDVQETCLKPLGDRWSANTLLTWASSGFDPEELA